MTPSRSSGSLPGVGRLGMVYIVFFLYSALHGVAAGERVSSACTFSPPSVEHQAVDF